MKRPIKEKMFLALINDYSNEELFFIWGLVPHFAGAQIPFTFRLFEVPPNLSKVNIVLTIYFFKSDRKNDRVCHHYNDSKRISVKF